MELNITWFILLVVLFSGYLILDGFDLGVGMIYFKAKTDEERRLMLNSIGPVWDGNEVWLITAGGALFAAFPNVYATVFSGFYTAFMLFLLVLVGRIASIEFRNKVENLTWKKIWDMVFLVSNYLIVILLGVTLGNVVAGVPVQEIGGVKEFGGNFFSLIHPYTVFVGIVAALALRLHGKMYMCMKVDGEFQARIKQGMKRSWILYFTGFILLSIWTWMAYPNSVKNFVNHPVWFVFPFLALISFALIPRLMHKNKFFGGFILSAITLMSLVVMVGVGIFPNLLIASNNPALSLTVFADSSSQSTLQTMFIIACIFVPIVLIYKYFVYNIFKGKVKLDSSSY